jgi:hypothetical protein
MRHKHADLIHAWAEGAEIQECRAAGPENDWRDATYPAWYIHNEYRIKPKEKVKKVKRNFK